MRAHSPQLLSSTREELGARLKEAEQELLNTIHAHRREMGSLRKDYNALQLKLDQLMAGRTGSGAAGSPGTADSTQLGGSVDALTGAVANLQAELLASRNEQSRLAAESADTLKVVRELVAQKGAAQDAPGTGSPATTDQGLGQAASSLASVASALREDMRNATTASAKASEENSALRMQLTEAISKLEKLQASNAATAGQKAGKTTAPQTDAASEDAAALHSAVTALREEAERLRTSSDALRERSEVTAAATAVSETYKEASTAEALVALRAEIAGLKEETAKAGARPGEGAGDGHEALLQTMADLRSELSGLREATADQDAARNAPDASNEDVTTLAGLVTDLRAELDSLRATQTAQPQETLSSTDGSTQVNAAAAADALKVATAELQEAVQRVAGALGAKDTSGEPAVNPPDVADLNGSLQQGTQVQKKLQEQLGSLLEALPALGGLTGLIGELQAGLEKTQAALEKARTSASEAQAAQAALGQENANLTAQLRTLLEAQETRVSAKEAGASDTQGTTVALQPLLQAIEGIKADIAQLSSLGAGGQADVAADAGGVDSSIIKLEDMINGVKDQLTAMQTARQTAGEGTDTTAAEERQVSLNALEAATAAMRESAEAIRTALGETKEAQQTAAEGRVASQASLDAGREALAAAQRALEEQVASLEAQVKAAADLTAARVGTEVERDTQPAADNASISALKSAMEEVASAKADLAVRSQELKALQEERERLLEEKDKLRAESESAKKELEEVGASRATLEGRLLELEKLVSTTTTGASPNAAIKAGSEVPSSKTVENGEGSGGEGDTNQVRQRRNSAHLHIMTARPMLLESQAALQRLLGAHFEQLTTLRELQTEGEGNSPTAQALSEKIDRLLGDQLADVAERLTQCEDALDIWCSRLNDQAVPVPDDAALEGDEFF
jgi:DNA repair exonuclease SbcCD ATPase subunit